MSDDLRGLHLHFDCASGAAGDMTLGALLDLGVPREAVTETLDRLGVGGDRLGVERVLKRGVSAVDVKVRVDGKVGHGHHHEHEHEHDHGHEHVHYRQIREMIVGARLEAEVARRALDMFDRVARAEARLHGTTVEEVAFHEVGAIDSIVDIVGTAAALAWLRPSSASAAAVAMGHGVLDCAHGILPVPAPAALEILREARAVMEDGGLARELCTPTGAAILAATVTRWGPMPPLTPVAVGYGAGDADLPDRANVLRVTAGQPVVVQASSEALVRPLVVQASLETLVRVEANLDDMSPELCEHVAARLFAAGAVDVWWTPITMKKSRPAFTLAALAPEPALDAVLATVLRETTSIGVRYDRVERRVLARESRVVATIYGELPIKVGLLGPEVVNAAPEYEPCRAAAERHGVPLKQVYAAVTTAFFTNSGMFQQ